MKMNENCENVQKKSFGKKTIPFSRRRIFFESFYAHEKKIHPKKNWNALILINEFCSVDGCTQSCDRRS